MYVIGNENIKMEEGSCSAIIDVTTENRIISEFPDEIKDNEGFNNLSLSLDNSLVQSPSIESFSTFQDAEVSELNMDQDTDLCVRVDNPQKQLETLETFILFRVVTKVARIEYQDTEYIVRRRYNDFCWLRQKLVETYPMLIVPSLPAKHTLIGQLDRYSKEFIITRMNMLNIFMNRIAYHPILSYDANLKVFLTAKPSEFISYRKNKASAMNKTSDSIQNITTTSTIKHRSIEFDKFKDYAQILHEKLSTIEKISLRINKERQDYISELNNYHPILMGWSSAEPPLSGLLIKISCAVERTATAQTQLLNDYNTTLGNPIREFILYVEVVRDVLNKRDNYQLTYESSVDDLSRKRCEKDQLVSQQQNQSSCNTSSSSHFSLWKPTSSDQKLEKLGTCIPQLVKQTESLQDRLECANEALRSDLDRWQLEKQASLKKMLMDFANKQIDYYQNCVDAWESVLSDNNITGPQVKQEISVQCQLSAS